MEVLGNRVYLIQKKLDINKDLAQRFFMHLFIIQLSLWLSMMTRKGFGFRRNEV